MSHKESYMERINTKKEHNQYSSVIVQYSNLRKITFMLFECCRFIDKSVDFISLCHREKFHDNKEFRCVIRVSNFLRYYYYYHRNDLFSCF